jgi:hypothetical protein
LSVAGAVGGALANANSAVKASTDNIPSSAKGTITAYGAKPSSNAFISSSAETSRVTAVAAKQTVSSATAEAAAQKQQQRAAAEAAVKHLLTKVDQGLTGLRAGLTQAVACVQQGLAQAGIGISNVLGGSAGRSQSTAAGAAAAAQPATFFATKALSSGNQVVQQSSQWLRRLLL